MPQLKLKEKISQALFHAACYQFALSGSEAPALLEHIDNKFSDLGNYLLTGDNKYLGRNNLTLERGSLDSIAGIQGLRERKNAIMQALAIEFNLNVYAGGGNPPFKLGGRFKTGDQMTPEHMWINDGVYSYDTMPDMTIFRWEDPDGTRPPLERDIPSDQIVLLGLKELTVYQAIIVHSAWG